MNRAPNRHPVRTLGVQIEQEDDEIPEAYQVAPMVPDDEYEETAADRVAAMIRSVNGDDRARLSVFRVIGPNKYGACGEYSISEFEEKSYSLIRRDWGPGEFQIRLYGIHPIKKNFGVLAKENIVIEKSLVEAPSSQNAVPSELSRVLESFAQTQQQMLQALTERPAAPDPIAQMTQMFTMMKLMREASGVEKPEKSSIAEIMEAVREMRAVSSELAPEKTESGDPLMAALPAMLDLIKGAQTQRPAQEQIAFAPVSLPATVQPNQSNQPMENIESAQLAQIADMLKQLCGLAKMNVRAETAAELVYDVAPDEIFILLKTENWFDSLPNLYAETATHKEWFLAVGKAALEMYEESANQPEDPVN